MDVDVYGPPPPSAWDLLVSGRVTEVALSEVPGALEVAESISACILDPGVQGTPDLLVELAWGIQGIMCLTGEDELILPADSALRRVMELTR